MTMFHFTTAETPEEIQHQEDWVNRTLQPDYPGVHVCLHADVTCSDCDGRVKIECDYCPTVMVMMCVPVGFRLVPYYSTD